MIITPGHPGALLIRVVNSESKEVIGNVVYLNTETKTCGVCDAPESELVCIPEERIDIQYFNNGEYVPFNEEEFSKLLPNKKIFTVHAQEMISYKLEVEAYTLTEAMQLVVDDPTSYTEQVEGEYDYIDGSFVINEQLTKEANHEEE